MTATTFEDGISIRNIAFRLINQDPGFQHLQGIPIKYLFRSKASTTNGKPNLGKVTLFSGAKAFLGVADDDEREELREAQGVEAFFVVECALNFWEPMDEPQREALVHELLCRCYCEDIENAESGTIRRLMILDYDFKGFAANVAKYGNWRKDIALIMDAAKVHIQPGFDFGISEPMAATARRENREAKVREKAERKAKKKAGMGDGDTIDDFAVESESGALYRCQTEPDGQGAVVLKFRLPDDEAIKYLKAVAHDQVPYDMAPKREYCRQQLDRMILDESEGRSNGRTRVTRAAKEAVSAS